MTSGITDQMYERIEKTIAHAKDNQEVLPIDGMKGYFVSRNSDVKNMRFLFSVAVDGIDTFVYIRLKGLTDA